MVAVGVEGKSFISSSMENSCGVLLQQLQHIWVEIGESKLEQDRILLEIEKECLQVYQRKVDEASSVKARLYQLVAAKEAEIADLIASLGEHNLSSQAEKRPSSLKEQLASITPLLEDLEARKAERVKQFANIQSQIEKITSEITENGQTSTISYEEQDLSMRKLNEYQKQLRSLQKEKSDRLQKVLQYTNQVHALCGVLGLEFKKTVAELHPSLHENSSRQSTNISTKTLDGLFQAVVNLKEERKSRAEKLRETVKSLLELWKLMDSSEEEKKHFGKVTCILDLTDEEVARSGFLSLDTIKQAELEEERLKKLKASRMKDLLLKRRLELEVVCRLAHIEPDMSSDSEKTIALIDSASFCCMDSGLVDPQELLANIEAQIMKAREECTSRKEIMERIDRWLAACEEENWLEEYNQDANRYNAGKGAHLSLKRAEKARMTVTKIPAIVDNLILKTFAWENQRNMPFLYDGARLISILEGYKLTRQQKEEANRQHRDHKKLQGFLENKSVYGSKPIPRRSNSFNTKPIGYHISGDENGFMTPTHKHAVSNATPQLLSPGSYSGHHNRNFRDVKRLSCGRLNFVNIHREDTSSSFASISGSEPESPPLRYH